jgi:hypothetical protein
MPTNAITAPPSVRTTALPDPAELARLRANLTEILEEPDLKSLEAESTTTEVTRWLGESALPARVDQL